MLNKNSDDKPAHGPHRDAGDMSPDKAIGVVFLPEATREF
jgi:hypothetical protein